MATTKVATAAAVVAVLSVSWVSLRPTAPSSADVAEPNDVATEANEDRQPSAPQPDPPTATDDKAHLVDLAGDQARTATGALTAARLFLELGEPATTLDRNEIIDLWRTVATEESADALIAEQMLSYDGIRADYPDGIHQRIVPLEARIASFDENAAVIDLWVLAVFEVPDGPAVQTWFTTTYRLEWERSRWLIADSDVVDGPTPMLSPTALTASTDVLKTLLAGFDDPWRDR